MEIGNKIVYPMHGAGVVEDISSEDFFGEQKLFCTLNVLSKDMTIKFPVERIEELNIRPIAHLEEILEAMDEKMNTDYMNTSNWNKRYQATLDKMKIGTPSEMAEVIVNLKRQDQLKGLSSGERQLLHNAVMILSSELMLSEGITQERAQTLIEKKLKEVLLCDGPSESS
ncbi:CarD family transcriptional regulator [Guggenheimella bovis]